MFLVFGLGFTITPETFAQLFIGSSIANGDLIIDMRATYGGISLALGCFTAWCAVDRKRTEQGLTLAFLVSLGLALSRVIGIIANGDAGSLMYFSITIEVFLGGISGWLMISGRRDAPVYLRG